MFEFCPAFDKKFALDESQYKCSVDQCTRSLIPLNFTVLPPVLVPRHSEFAPNHPLLQYQSQQQPRQAPHCDSQNVPFSDSGFHQQAPNSPLNGTASSASSSAHSPYQVNCVEGKPVLGVSSPSSGSLVQKCVIIT